MPNIQRISFIIYVGRTRFAQARAELGMTDRTGGPRSTNYIHRRRPENFEEEEEVGSDGEDVVMLKTRAAGRHHDPLSDAEEERLRNQDLALARSLRLRAEDLEKVVLSMLEQPPPVLPIPDEDILTPPNITANALIQSAHGFPSAYPAQRRPSPPRSWCDDQRPLRPTCSATALPPSALAATELASCESYSVRYLISRPHLSACTGPSATRSGSRILCLCILATRPRVQPAQLSCKPPEHRFCICSLTCVYPAQDPHKTSRPCPRLIPGRRRSQHRKFAAGIPVPQTSPYRL